MFLLLMFIARVLTFGLNKSWQVSLLVTKQIYYFVCVKYLLIFVEKSTTSKFLSYVLLLNITKAKVHDSFFLTILDE